MPHGAAGCCCPPSCGPRAPSSAARPGTGRLQTRAAPARARPGRGRRRGRARRLRRAAGRRRVRAAARRRAAAATGSPTRSCSPPRPARSYFALITALAADLCGRGHPGRRGRPARACTSPNIEGMRRAVAGLAEPARLRADRRLPGPRASAVPTLAVPKGDQVGGLRRRGVGARQGDPGPDHGRAATPSCRSTGSPSTRVTARRCTTAALRRARPQPGAPLLVRQRRAAACGAPGSELRERTGRGR